MVVQESVLAETVYSKDMNDTIDESEETLSLCDLPLYSDQSADWDHCISLDSHASISTTSSREQEEDDYFEFFSQELNHSTATAFPPENIIFCGKPIPYKQQATCEIDSSDLVEIKNKEKRSWRLFRSKFSSNTSSKGQKVSKNGTRSTTNLMHHQSPKKVVYNTNKLGGKGNGRMSISTTTAGKAKWYLLLFGISRFSPVVEMRDIKTRQSHRSSHFPSSPPSSPPTTPMFGFQNNDDKLSYGGGWGLWGLIRALSCGGNHQSITMATTAIGSSASPE